jgi:flavin reductase (DIM6/NTAB) family NADH-FMN oxidoreductase RutF
MTISWGSVGVYWARPVITAPVRASRFTRGLIEQSGVFTISIPKKGELSKELAYCGTKSGRDGDKFAGCGLTVKPGRSVPAPIIGEAWMHIECRVLCKYDSSTGNYDAATDSKFYSDKNYHTYYLGEVVDFYEL